MYRIIGADGREYGDVTAETMRKWISEGRVNAQTRVLPEGGTEWKTLAEIPELAAMLGAPPAPMEVLPDDSYARGQVNGPAIGLMVAAVLSILANLYQLISSLMVPRTVMHLPPELQQFEEVLNEILNASHGPLGITYTVLALIVFVIIFVGAIRMQQLRSYALAMTASILSLVPCSIPCCCISIPIGIWALVVLCKANVKSAFK